MEFKGTKALRIIGSNQAGFAIGNNNGATITVWGDDDEAKANVKAILHMSEMLEMLSKVLEVNKHHGFNGHLINEQIKDLLTRATTI